MPKGDLSSLQAKASELMNLLQLNETSKKHLQETGYAEVNSGQIEQQLKWLEERRKDLQNAEDFISQVSLSLRITLLRKYLGFCKLWPMPNHLLGN